MKISPVRVRGSGAAVISVLKFMGSFCFVERRPLRVCFMCPFAVPVDLFRCLWTAAEVRPGQVVKLPASIAEHHVETTGFHIVWWW